MKYRIKSKRLKHLYVTPQKFSILILTASLYFGIIAGSLILSRSNAISGILVGYAQSITTTAPIGHIILNDFLISFIFYCGLFLLGMSIYGYIFIPIFPFIKGFSYGFSAAFYYAVFGSRGIVICALGLLPQAFLFSGLLLAAAYLAFSKSRSFQTQSTNRATSIRNSKQFNLTFFVLFAISFLLFIFDVFCTGNVINLFC